MPRGPIGARHLALSPFSSWGAGLRTPWAVRLSLEHNPRTDGRAALAKLHFMMSHSHAKPEAGAHMTACMCWTEVPPTHMLKSHPQEVPPRVTALGDRALRRC